MAQLIYFADDEKNIRELIYAFLTQAGYEVRTFANGEELLNACDETTPDLVVVDILMPGPDGLEVCRALKSKDKNLPIIIVSAKDSPYDRVKGFSSGSDDYMVKPFLPPELIYRIKLLLKYKDNETEEKGKVYSLGSLYMYPEQRSVRLHDKEIQLTPSEYEFLLYMLANKDRAIKRDELFKAVWQTDWQMDTRATDDLVKRLRTKLRENNSDVRIETVWGYGFKLSVNKVSVADKNAASENVSGGGQ